jgi:hypothetical protein
MLEPQALRMAYSARAASPMRRPVKPSTRTKQKLIKNNKQLLWHWTPSPELPSELHGLAYDDESRTLIKALIDYLGKLHLYALDTQTNAWRVSTLEEWNNHVS